MIAPLTSFDQFFELQPDGLAGYFALSILFGFCFLYFWIARNQDFFGKRFFMITNLALIWWLFAAIMELWSVVPFCKAAWGTLAFPAIGLVPVSWFLFVYRYARGETGPMERWQKALLIVVPSFISLLCFTNPWHWLFYSRASAPVSDVRGAALHYDHGPFFALSSLLLYVFILGGFIILFRAAARAHGSYRLHFLQIFILTIAPIVANIAYVFSGWTIAGIDPTPFMFSVILLLYSLLILSNQTFQISSVARDMVFETLPNAVLVVGRDGRVLGHNATATELFSLRNSSNIPASEIPGLAKLLETLMQAYQPGAVEDVSIGTREFEVQTSHIPRPFGSDDRFLGWLFVFFDITERKIAAKTLKQELSVNDEKLRDMRIEHHRIKNEALSDPLTGLLNRRALSDEFDEMVASCSLEKGPIMVTVIDIDHFKSINDRFGHAVGDRALIAVSGALRRAFRREDRLFRIGGEEFVVLSPNLDIKTLEDRIEELREIIFAAGENLGLDGLELRFSAGIAERPLDRTALSDLIDMADKRLYAAKSAGRNRTIGPDGHNNIRH
ncbi:histidine kinase N-terminal 7TM domain-containing protein [Thioclava sp. JE_KL1]|uniref:histidine kinase N-terminal 7TM domain-containing diguanylate cyclase n=1 Tax=Thioclava sp. JE_KL1 TaxID=2651187 RepID=UPI00128CE4B6|nr:diguanylate cyclase [Thioclava sp. JE_KL1]